MNNMKHSRNDLLAQQIITGLKNRNMTGYYVSNREEALELALSMIPEGSKVAGGGSASVVEIGLQKALENGNYDYHPRKPDRENTLFAYDADIYLCSSNAITYDGVLVNLDGNSNRVSALAYGPKKVILIVGMNKAAPDVDSAVKRARNEAAPVNALRFGKNTPCTKLGRCMDCKSPDTVCCQLMITRYSHHKDRIHVILVNDDLGF